LSLPPLSLSPLSATWREAKAEGSCRFPKLEDALREYQEPAKVDKIMKLDKQLNETKDILYKTIDKVLQRGEKLDELVDKSSALSNQSKLFYKQVRMGAVLSAAAPWPPPPLPLPLALTPALPCPPPSSPALRQAKKTNSCCIVM
jgi:hypothetical protein